MRVALCLVGSFLRKHTISNTIKNIFKSESIDVDVYLVTTMKMNEFDEIDNCNIENIKQILYNFGFKNVKIKILNHNFKYFYDICKEKGYMNLSNPSPARMLSFAYSVSECFNLIENTYNYLVMSRYDYLDEINITNGLENLLLKLNNKTILGELYYKNCVHDLLICGNFNDIIELKNYYSVFWENIEYLQQNPITIENNIFDNEQMLTNFLKVYGKIENIIHWNDVINTHEICSFHSFKPNYNKYSNEFQNLLTNLIENK